MKQEDLLRADYLRAVAVDYAKDFIGIPYRWAGDDPMSGFDCSGFVVEVLQAVGKLAHGSDFSAAKLYEVFEDSEVEIGYMGCLAFWFEKGAAVHVMMMIDKDQVIGAAGGGSATTSIEQAMKQNAFVKIRPLDYRKGAQVIVDPFRKILE